MNIGLFLTHLKGIPAIVTGCIAGTLKLNFTNTSRSFKRYFLKSNRQYMNWWFTDLISTKIFNDSVIVVTHLNQTNVISNRARQYNPATLLTHILLFTLKLVMIITELKENLCRDDKLTSLLLLLGRDSWGW